MFDLFYLKLKKTKKDNLDLLGWQYELECLIESEHRIKGEDIDFGTHQMISHTWKERAWKIMM